jgi:hypothetical protein
MFPPVLSRGDKNTAASYGCQRMVAVSNPYRANNRVEQEIIAGRYLFGKLRQTDGKRSATIFLDFH